MCTVDILFIFHTTLNLGAYESKIELTSSYLEHRLQLNSN
jgi:hypothetical protein